MKTTNLLSRRARRTGATLILLSITGLLPTTRIAAAASPSELLEQGIYSEETKGDVDAALKLYQQVVAEAKAGQAIAAQAQYRVGVCYCEKKNYAEANAAFEKLTRDYPDQKDLIALANKYLANTMPLMPAPWVEGEEMQLDLRFPTGFKIGAACYEFGECRLDLAAHKLFKKNVEVELTAKEFRLLEFFAKRAGRALTRDSILEAVWGNEVIVADRSADRCVTTLRSKIELDSREPRFIHTIRDIGYRFEDAEASKR